MRIESWDSYFMAMAKLAACRSGCNSRPTGAVIVKDYRIIATGYNGTIAGAEQCSDQGAGYCKRRASGSDDSGEKKYQECPSIHAEQNALNQMAKYGGKGVYGASIYCTLFPCIHCMKNILSCNIKNVYYELAYESNDPARDLYWRKWAQEYGILIKQVTLYPEEKDLIFCAIVHKTSERRL